MKHYAIKAYGEGGGEAIAPSFLTSALDGGEWSASRPCCFSPRDGVPGTQWLRDWVGPRNNLDPMKKRKVSFPCRKSNTGLAASSLVAKPTKLSWLNITCKVLKLNI
jgi:hypothetical protein